jgi:hypothetical protein
MLSDAVWVLICAQIVMGAFDTIFHHELTERLAWRRSQAQEMRLHGARNLFYAVIFAVIGLTAPAGAFAAVLLFALYAELVITLWDFVEEDRTRALPPSERVLHTLLALNYGAILFGVTAPLLAAAQLPTALCGCLGGDGGVRASRPGRGATLGTHCAATGGRAAAAGRRTAACIGDRGDGLHRIAPCRSAGCARR